MRRLRYILKCNSTAVFLRLFFGIGGRGALLFFFFFLFNFGGLTLAGQEPIYIHSAAESHNLDSFSVTVADAFSPQAKINRLIIAVEIGPDGEKYVLTFGNGIKKVGPNGGLINFISNTGDKLSNAMDFAINSEGKFFVATNESNRRFVRVYSPGGGYLPDETLGDGTYGAGANKFRGPVGLAFDQDDKLYVADHYIGNDNPPIPSFIKIYGKDAAGNYKNNLIKEFHSVNGNSLNFPYRIAVNPQGQIYISELGPDNNAKVQIITLDSNFDPVAITNGPSAGLGAPGSIIIDKFGYIYVADFGNEIDLPRLLEATGDIDEFYAVFEIIKRGIQKDVFNINIYNPDNSLNSKISSQIDFPIDFAISSCGTLYVDNAIFDGEIDEYCLFPWGPCYDVPDFDFDFDLEAYKRPPGYDTESPVLVTCPDDLEEELENGSFVLQDYKGLADFRDNCDANWDIVQSPPLNTRVTETTEVTLIAYDDSGNKSGVCSFTVILAEEDDTSNPVFTNCPASKLSFGSDPDQCGAIVNYNIPVATDDSGTVSIDRLEGPAPGSVLSVGTVNVIYRATDAAGNTAECSFTIEVTDDKDPIITCPGDVVKTAALGDTGIVVDYAQPTPADNCSGVTFRQTAGQESGTEFPVGETVNTFEVKDASGNTATCSFTITVKEPQLQPPVFANCPSDIPNISVDSGKCGAEVNFTPPTASDESGAVAIDLTSEFGSGDLFPVGTTTVTYKATNSAGTTSCSFEVTVIDDEDPVISVCPTNITRQLTSGESSVEIEFAGPTATDNCGNVSIVQTSGAPSGSSFSEGSYPIEFTITDASGNSATCSFTITVTEPQLQAPVFANCPSDIPNISVDLGKCGAVVDFTPPTASDESGAVNVELTTAFGPGDLFPVGTTTVTYEAANLAGITSCSFEVTVIDDEGPQINCIPDQRATANGSGTAKVFFPVPSFEDCSGGDIEQTTGPASGNNFPIGTTPITFTATDAYGNISLCTFNIVVSEAKTVACKETDLFLDSNGNATLDPKDLYDGDPDAANILRLEASRENFSCDLRGPQPVTLFVRFTDGTSASCETVVNVLDRTGPEIKCIEPGKIFTLVDGSLTLSPSDLFEEISDNCPVLSYRLSQNTFTTTGTKSIKVIAEDSSGNISECTTSIEVIEANGPSVTCKTTDLQLGESGSVELDPVDIFDGDPNDPAIDKLEVSRVTFTCEDVGNQLVDLMVYYTDGSLATCSTNITVTDEISPVAGCVSSYTLRLSENGTGFLAVEEIDASSTDNCSITSRTLSKNSFSTADLGDQQVTLTVVDASGNEDTCTTTVTVVPYQEGGAISCPEAITLALDENGKAALSPENIYSGNGEGVQFSLDQETFTCEDIGTQEVILSYSGAATGSCSVAVTIVDNTPPMVKCVPDFTLYLNEEGSGILSESIIDRGSTDNCGIQSMSLSKLRFTTEDIGEQQITLTVTDFAGNTTTCETTLTVAPYNANGGISCVDALTIPLSQAGDFTLTLRYTGNPENEEVEISKTHFTCEDIGTETVTATYWGEYTGSCDIEVTIVDDLGPQMNCISEYDLKLSEDGTAIITTEDLLLSVEDNCQLDDVQISRTEFTTSDIGVQQVTLTANDIYGNETTCTVSVNVQPHDEVEPGFQCVESIELNLDQNGEALLNPRELHTGGSGTVQYSVSKEKFTCADLGEQTISLSYSTADEEGTCEIKVIVKDPESYCYVGPVDPPPAEDSFVMLYPNPSEGRFRIRVSPDIFIQRTEVFDTRGRFLFARDYQDVVDRVYIFDFDLREFQSGVYTIRLISDSREYVKRAIILND